MTTTKTLDQLIRSKAVKAREDEMLSALRKIMHQVCGHNRVRLTSSESSSADVIRVDRGWLVTQFMALWRANNAVEIGDKAVAIFLRDHKEMAEQIQGLQSCQD